jgi:hypothetical protein
MTLARYIGLALSCGAVLMSGCSIGPNVVRMNFLRYNDAVADKENEQFLLNIVKLRYRDPPKSLAIGNIATQIQVDATSPISFVTGFIGKTQNILLPQGRYADVPTISMSPLTGADYIQGMVTPVPLERIVLLASSGWDLERLLRLLVFKMNGLENAAHLAGVGGERAPRYVEFNAVAHTLGRLQHEGLLELSAEPHPVPVAILSEPLTLTEKDALKPTDLINAASKNYIFEVDKEKKVTLKSTMQGFNLNVANEAWRDSELHQAARLLKVTEGHKYNLVPGETGHLTRKNGDLDNRILLSTRSVLTSMLFLSRGVSVPEKHYREGLVAIPLDEAGQPFDWTLVTEGVFRVCVSKHRPKHDFVSVKYRGYWFYIADNDLSSKSTFNLILEMHNVQITKGMTSAPLLTLPVSGSSGGGRGKGGG